jgi:hypothetical protein
VQQGDGAMDTYAIVTEKIINLLELFPVSTNKTEWLD